MAKAATSKTDSDKKKKAKAGTAVVKAKGKKDKASKSVKAKKVGKAKSDGFDGLAKLADHPLVADLLAAGAIAAVAAIAEHQLGDKKGQSSAKLVKSAGKAAAAAMGKKLMGDIGSIAGAATDAAKKA